ncbi:hypothetical protein [Shewanella pealeana]|uniref:Lipoprotein n=1 Tax=Shewanella pealeana (strain ATCC 700345 / ANG-SQ1) TaxID=398579 RepID=A8H862_SHEPA|nr:hypothetical protein [Shewanella pealeana]ABV88749.1 conserved hypothetical protein [Shewanella pealeana ATCC 700345]
MKVKLLSAMLASSMLLLGCGSDDDNNDVTEPPVVVPPPVEEVIDIDEASTIAMSLDSVDAATGALTFSLKDGDNKAITKATDYDIFYFGYPDPASPSTKAKAWKRWHVTQGYKCDTSTDEECVGILTETATKGQYTFDAIDLDLEGKAAAGAVALYKVAIQIHGAQASNEIELIAAEE